ncbi:MAG: hypothetical protein EPN21_03590 [Methylococcaceae bacterium]|nr:MAG: hypothetical protein EPN21_03590 [Methylococcaceae bacterium]
MNDHPHPPSRCAILLLLALELALTGAAAIALRHLAQPLALPARAAGWGQRYAVSQPAADFRPFAESQRFPLLREVRLALAPKPQRAQRWNSRAGDWLAGGAGIGWLALWLARRQRPGAGWICSALWSMAAMLPQPYGLPGGFWWTLAALCLAGYLCFGIFNRQGGVVQARTGSAAAATLWSATGWPGWVFFTGIGLLWVIDFAARGPERAAFFGLYQADALWLANLSLSLAALWRDRWLTGLVRAATALTDLWMRRRGPLLLGGCGLLLTLAIGCVGRPDDVKPWPGLAKPHLSSELLRSIFAIALAWCLYRAGEYRTSRPRIRSTLLQLGAVLLLVLAGLAWSRDGGPALVIFLALCLTFNTPLAHALASRHAAGGLLALLVLMLAGWASWDYAVHDIAPRFSQRAAERAAAIHAPYRAGSPYLAQVHWLMDATPPAGFGLARVPWCGAKAMVGIGACTLGSGAPLQTPSDYAPAGLAAVYGLPGAALLLFALLIWLAGLSWPGLAAWRSGRAPPWALLQCWLVVVFALLALAQTLITVGGSLGAIPLTGVTLPLLGYGGAALCMAALWAGLALNPAGSQRRLP